MTHRLTRGVTIIVFAAALAGSAWGQVTISTATADTTPFTVSNTDLLQTNLSSATINPVSGYNFFGTNSLGTLTDGNFGATGGNAGTALSSVSFLPATAITFSLDLTASPAGYDISQIRTYTGWDTGRDGQEYTVAYSTASAPATFLTLASVGPYNFGTSGTGNGNMQVTIYDLLAGPLVSNVAALRFTFTSFENGSSAWREIDVIGTAAAIPEPATSACFSALMAGVALLIRCRQLRRHRHVRCG